MSRLIDTNLQHWQAVRPELTKGVSGKLLRDGATKIVLTKVEPGGTFAPHRDNYEHLFYFLSGTGLVLIGQEQIEVGPGVCLQVAVGELHGYENNGEDDLLLISANIYKS